MNLVKLASTVAVSATLSLALNGLAQAENLLDVYHLALKNDAQFRSASYQYESALETRKQARAAFLPQIQAGGTSGLNDVNDDRNETYNSNRLSLSLNQSIYSRANRIVSKQADLTIAQAQAELTAAEQDLIFRSASVYFGVLAAEENLIFAQSEKKAIEQQLEQAERRFEVGLIAITDVKEAQAAYDLAVAEEIAAENNLANAREALRVVTGQNVENYQPLGEEAPLIKPDPQEVEMWVNTAETQNLSLHVAEYSAEIANQQIEAARSGHFPTLSAGASYANTSQDGGTGDSEIGALQLQLDVPIYSGGLVSSQTRQAKSQAKLAAEQYELTRRNVAQQTRNAYRGVLAGISRVIALERALQSTQIAAEATETGFEVGTRTAVEVLQSLRDVFRARANYSSARYDYILNTLALKQAAGILELTDLEAINGWLTPQ
ncbi:MAG: TolC family outer membrane protein [Gammaproteobacteria bacterium]|nr:TolC family outer membrane protein [Gammaproteobacteria bacterium]